MHALELPHTHTCLVCGRSNPHGLKLRLHVAPESGLVSTEFIPKPEHVGFDGIEHGGLLATVLDEAMVWASSWRVKRFCIAGEVTVRYRQPLTPGEAVRVEASVEFNRPKLVEAVCKVFDFAGKLIATGSGKYVPVSPEQHLNFMKSFIDDPHTAAAAAMFKGTPVPAASAAQPAQQQQQAQQ
jgi:acyl-coenzyme A thioesterase PaaI-like protein